MDKIILADYIGHSDNSGKPMGHPVKVINETCKLISPMFQVRVAAPKSHVSMIQLTNEMIKLEYNLCVFSNQKISNLMKKWKNLKKIFKNQGEDIVWFINVDFSLFLYLYLKDITKNRIWINLCYNPLKNVYGWKKTVIETVLNKVERVVLTNRNFQREIPGNTMFMPDYYYNEALYDKYQDVPKRNQMACLGTMGKEKKLEDLISIMKDSLVPLVVFGNFKHDCERFENLQRLSGENISLENKFVNDEEYYDLISKSRYVVLPYDMALYDERTSGILLEAVFLHSIPVAPLQLLRYNGIDGIGYQNIDEIPMMLGDLDHEQKIINNNNKLIKSIFSAESIQNSLVK